MESYTVCACTMVTMDFGHIYGKNRGLLMDGDEYKFEKCWRPNGQLLG